MYATINKVSEIKGDNLSIQDAPELTNVFDAAAFARYNPEFDVYYVKKLKHCVIVRKRAVIEHPVRRLA